MAFSTALSGLNAASNMLSVTGNNIANVNTTGFKKSRSEFADVYASLGGSSKTTPGAGVVVANDAQLFTQGNLQSTDNMLDLAVSGDGFFVLGESVTNPLSRTYSRAGMFHADQNGYIVNNANQPLLAYKPNGTTVEEGFSTGVFQPIQVGVTQGAPKATSNVSSSVNLDARMNPPINPFIGPSPTPNDSVDPNSYNSTSSVTIYDSLGNTHILSQYYVKMNADPAIGYGINQWRVYSYLDGQQLVDPNPAALPAGDPGTQLGGGTLLQFDQSGNLKGTVSDASDPLNPVLTSGGGNNKISYNAAPTAVAPNAAPISITLDLTGSSQVGSSFSVNGLSQDGLAIGKLSSLDINDQGVVFARFSNGAARPLGQVALARFQNPQGLSKLGDTKWAENTASGQPLYGVATTGAYGAVKSGNLESSNVNLSQELVNLIVAQQAFQANAQTISTENDVTKTLLQIR